ncbi:GIY-YIG nuclease family protein [Mucilaginibacter ginsenosidivorax]|uniref:GIY-YIG nuclease family protein n=1 Tax=Mucilaginibacter ginsenosidivorax TaxID=862126 RepID=A0A5B8VZM4_9SPHI|nr:GIY-YIG nuclease family protein [Mucilaginibacter ginsenosidivorax]QEC76969.1 GIY-YIG nuclease family protein [Mucilaginibacter ginsenosidivorax]
MGRGGYIYIVTNMTHSVLYIGVTSDIVSRIWDHKNKTYPDSFTAKYNCNKLVYYEGYPHIEEAIAAEKLLKGGSRANKIRLINEMNPEWKDLYDGLVDDLN